MKIQDVLEADLLDVYADGSFRPKSSTGGWAFVVFQHGQEIHRALGFATGMSNNTFELLAVLKAAAWIANEHADTSATIWTDSSQTVKGCQISRAIWRNNGWRRIEANPKKRNRVIQDVALWQELDRQLTANPRIRIAWCRGHDDIPGNELADAMARTAAMATNVTIG
ncbi:ribonuclease HI [Rhizobiaceae bacterium CRRU44]|uniref:ribonuclease H n=1 Tax=Ferranicluibacter rubi TaxID=2715133 RepID=A0AA43ZFL5_9HYPH|nr:ribonuclease HI [Ferranicluibacter rubi]